MWVRTSQGQTLQSFTFDFALMLLFTFPLYNIYILEIKITHIRLSIRKYGHRLIIMVSGAILASVLTFRKYWVFIFIKFTSFYPILYMFWYIIYFNPIFYVNFRLKLKSYEILSKAFGIKSALWEYSYDEKYFIKENFWNNSYH